MTDTGATAPPQPHAEQQPGFFTGLALVLPISLAVMAVVALAPILPKLLAQFHDVGNADYWVPMMLTVTALCVAAFSWLAGWLGDRFGKRRILIGALIAYGVVGIAPAFLNSFWLIFATRVGVGICESLILVLTTTMLADFYTGTARDKWLAAQTAIASLSALVLFAAGGALGAYGWQAPFFIYATSFVLLAGVVAFTWEPPQAPRRQGRAIASEADFPWAITGWICAITLFASIMFYVPAIQMSVGLTELGVTGPARIGLLTALSSLGVPIGTVLFRLASRFQVAILLMMEFAILAAGFAGMGISTGVTGFVIASTVNQIGAGMILPTLLTWAMRQFPEPMRGRGTGIWQGAFQIGQFLSPITVAFLASRVGGLFAVFAMLGVACGAASAAAIVATLTRRPASMVS